MTILKKKYILALFGFVMFLGLASYSPFDSKLGFKETILTNFKHYLLYSLDEKVYLQTDKPYYSSGENIWFKGYLVSEATLEPHMLSRYIYVELINRLDSVVSRVKICKDSTGFAGFIKLIPNLPSGDYNLRAYTH